MKIMVFILGLLALTGVAFGSYEIICQSSTKAVGKNETEYVTNSEILALRGEIAIESEKNRLRLQELEEIVGQQSRKIDELNRKIATLKNVTPEKISSGKSADAVLTPIEIDETDREALKELIGELSEEIRQEEREKQNEKMVEEMARAQTRAVDVVAEKYNWDEIKKAQVLEILDGQKQKIETIRMEARNSGEDQERRREILSVIRTVREETVKALSSILSEEEMKDIQRASSPRRERRPGFGGRSRGERR